MNWKNGVILLIIGILIMAGSIFSYKSVSSNYYETFTQETTQCDGTTFNVRLAYLGAEGTGKVVGYYSNNTVKLMREFTWKLLIVNDPCKDGYAEVWFKSSLGQDGRTKVSINELYSWLVAPVDLLVLYGQPSAYASDLGPSATYRVDFQPMIRQGPVNGTYYIDFTTYHYQESTGLLLGIESERILSYGNSTEAPKYVLVKINVEDLYSSNDEGASYTSYSRSLNIETFNAFLSGLYFIVGLVITAYGGAKIFSS